MHRATTILVALLAGLGLRPAAAETTRLDIAFHFYMGGYHALTMAASAELMPKQYRLRTETNTNGLADTIFRFTQTALVEGLRDAGGLSPLRFEAVSDGRWNNRQTGIAYGEGTPELIKLLPPQTEDDRDPVPDHLRRDTIDPLSAGLSAMLRDAARPCAGSAPVFDGRRRYNLHFEAVGQDQLKLDGGQGYAGPALRCLVRFEPIAGFMKKYEDKTREARPPTELWLAQLGPGEHWLPVRLESPSGFGRAVGHLVSASVNDRPVWAAKARN